MFGIFIFLIIIIIQTSAACPSGYFSLQNGTCHTFLTCDDIRELILGELIGFGAVKQIYKSTWRQLDVAVVTVNNPAYIQDFEFGLNLLIRMNPNPLVTTLFGYCKSSHVYVVKYYPYGPLKGFEKYLPLNQLLNLRARLNICLGYIAIIKFLHTYFNMPAVMCDSSTLSKTLEQYLIDSYDSIVLNDVDSIALVEIDGILCGKREITGDLAAPEQLWPYQGIPFNKSLMKMYNEKSDIWKIPNVCSHILGSSPEAENINRELYKINNKCKHPNPTFRPDASEVLNNYSLIFSKFENMKLDL